MRKSTIDFTIKLDDKNIPEKILWNASEKESDNPDEVKAISISLWDHIQKNTMRMDLWTKEMPIDEMKRFYIDCLGGLGQSLLTSTGDELMAKKINELCDELVNHIKNNN